LHQAQAKQKATLLPNKTFGPGMQNYCPIKLFVARTKQKIFPYLLFSAQIEHNLLLNNFLAQLSKNYCFFCPSYAKTIALTIFFRPRLSKTNALRKIVLAQIEQNFLLNNFVLAQLSKNYCSAIFFWRS